MKAFPKAELAVEIMRFVEERQPPIVACEFLDAGGRRHTIVDKAPIFGADWLVDAKSPYPLPGVVRCGVLAQWRDAHGRDLVRVSMAKPDHVESTEGLSEFVVVSGQLSLIPETP